MKAICVNDFSAGSKLTYLTKDKIYEIDPISSYSLEIGLGNKMVDKLVRIMDDSGNAGYYRIGRFIPLEEYRNTKIEEILK